MKQESMGAMITSKRKALGMTQLDLAEKMGVTDKAVSKWERDLSVPDVESLPRLAEIFGMTVDELLRAKAEPVRRGVHDIVLLCVKAVCLAMGVGTAVLSALGRLDVQSGFTLLGLGLACAGVVLLNRE